MRTIDVTSVRIPAGSSIGYIEGIDIETGETVTAAADIRSTWSLADAIEAGEIIEASVEGWQVLSVSAN